MNITVVVSDFVKKVESIIHEAVESRVRDVLAGAFGRRGPGRPRKGAPVAAARPVRSKPVSAKVARQRKIQGEYLGTIRHLNAGQRAKVKAVAKKDGVAAGLAYAKKLKK